MDHYYTPQALAYIRKLFVHEDTCLQQVGTDLDECEHVMQLAPEEGKILQLLIGLSGAKRVIELGVLHGYSSICIAKALPEDGHVYAIEKNYKRIQPPTEHFKRCGVDDKITLIEGLALDVLPSLESDGPFDAIFIDADKGNYHHYAKWADKHIKKGGLIIGDNSLLFGHVYQNTPPEDISEQSWKSMRQFNAHFSNPDKYLSMLLPTAQGLTVAMKLF